MSYKPTVLFHLNELAVSQFGVTDSRGRSLNLNSGVSSGTEYQMSKFRHVNLDTVVFRGGRDFLYNTYFTISFWLKSVNYGTRVNGEPIIMPLLSKAEYSSNATDYETSNDYITISEKTLPNNQNVLCVKLTGKDADFNTVSYYGEFGPYETGVYNFFYITKDSHVLKVAYNFIDPTPDPYYETGTVPTYSSSPDAPFLINFLATASKDAFEKNTGAIDDLFIINEVTTDNYAIANYGALYEGYEDYTDVEEEYLPFVFDDPSTIVNNSITNQDGDIYIAKSNNQIQKGVRNIWDKTINLKDYNKIKNNIIERDTPVSIEDDRLKVTNQIIRL